MNAEEPTMLLAYLHPGDLTASELFAILLATLAALALPLILIGVFVWFVARPKEEALSIQNSDGGRGRE